MASVQSVSETCDAGAQPTLRPAPDVLLVQVAEYVLSPEPPGDLARDAAAACLLESLTRAFDALQVRACARLLGPVVPGATMPRGARVPGTSYELDPVKAATDLGTLLRWPQGVDTVLAEDDGRCLAHDTVAAPLVVADYLARVALASARKPPTVRDLLARLIQAHEIASALSVEDRSTGVGLDALLRARVAAAAVVAGMVGGSRDQIVAALANAWLDDSPLPRLSAASADGPTRALAMGDAAGRAVCLALRALTAETGSPATAGAAACFSRDAVRGGRSVVLARSLGCGAIAQRHRADVGDVLAHFETSVTRHFPPAQAGKLTALFKDRARLEAMPVNELVSLMVRN